MKKLLSIFILILFSCSKKEELNPEFRKVIIDYQKTYPVKKFVKGNKYIYVATFSKEQNDTIFIIFRTSDGIQNTKNFYGSYNDTELKNFIVYDKTKLSSKQIKIYKKEIPDSLFFKRKSYPVSVTPRSKYKL